MSAMTLGEMVGDKMVHCDESHPITTITLCFPAEGDGSDWAYCQSHFNLDSDATSIQLCWSCQDELPSIVAKRNRSRQVQAENAAKADAEEALKIAEGVDLHTCVDCEKVWELEELVPVRFCTFCDATFDAQGGRNCENCNRPFTRKCTTLGCPDCLD